MTFEQWWKQMKPAECDELKPYFEEAWCAAVAAERKACAARCREFGKTLEVDVGECFAEEIMARPNVGKCNPFEVHENGPWVVDDWSNDRIVLQSEDFAHDAALEVSGDFGSKENRRKYAEEIAQRLNVAPAGLTGWADRNYWKGYCGGR
jgi:hypothetical protein